MYPSIWQILILLLVVLLVFGTRKIRNLGSDLGGAVRDFRKGISESDEGESEDTAARSESATDAAAGKHARATPAGETDTGSRTNDPS